MSTVGADEIENGNDMEDTIEESEGERSGNYDDPVSCILKFLVII